MLNFFRLVAADGSVIDDQTTSLISTSKDELLNLVHLIKKGKYRISECENDLFLYTHKIEIEVQEGQWKDTRIEGEPWGLEELIEKLCSEVKVVEDANY